MAKPQTRVCDRCGLKRDILDLVPHETSEGATKYYCRDDGPNGELSCYDQAVPRYEPTAATHLPGDVAWDPSTFLPQKK